MNKFYYSIFGPYMVQFIQLKNSLGYKYTKAYWALSLFDHLAYEKDVSEPVISKELSEEYCIKRPNETEKSRYNRISFLSQFARFLSDLGFMSYIPKGTPVRNMYMPYIFTQEQMQTVFQVSNALCHTPRNRNSSVFAIPALIRLLYGTGIRISEALYLTNNDINLQDKYLLLRDTKNGKDRMVPISDSLAKVCQEYLECRNLFPSIKKADTFFIKPEGSSLTENCAYKWFRRIIYKANISHGGRATGPRLHDLRHTFSVHSLAAMSMEGLDIYYTLPVLSTYLGHQSLRGTDIYVRLTAEMYPDLIKKISLISSQVFPSTNTNTENYETD